MSNQLEHMTIRKFLHDTFRRYWWLGIVSLALGCATQSALNGNGFVAGGIQGLIRGTIALAVISTIGIFDILLTIDQNIQKIVDKVTKDVE